MAYDREEEKGKKVLKKKQSPMPSVVGREEKSASFSSSSPSVSSSQLSSSSLSDERCDACYEERKFMEICRKALCPDSCPSGLMDKCRDTMRKVEEDEKSDTPEDNGANPEA